MHCLGLLGCISSCRMKRRMIFYTLKSACLMSNTSNAGVVKQTRTSLILGEATPEELFNVAMTILQKPTTSRSYKDTAILVNGTSSIVFFQNVGPEVHEECVKVMTYEFIPEGQNVFRAGDGGTKFYVILRGSVGVWVNVAGAVDPNDSKKVPEPIWREVRVLRAGESFGELALINNKPRSATITCKEDCHFAILEKEYYKDILKERQEKEIMSKLHFLYSVKAFSKWNYNLLRSVYLNSEPTKDYKINQVVYVEGALGSTMYVIKEGQFKVTKEVDLEGYDNSSSMRQHLLMVNTKMRRKNIEVSILGPGEIFGEDDLLMNRPRFTTVTCSTETGVLLEVRREDFDMFVLGEETSRTWVRKNLDAKRKFISERIHLYLKSTRPNSTFMSSMGPGESRIGPDDPRFQAYEELKKQIKRKMPDQRVLEFLADRQWDGTRESVKPTDITTETRRNSPVRTRTNKEAELLLEDNLFVKFSKDLQQKLRLIKFRQEQERLMALGFTPEERRLSFTKQIQQIYKNVKANGDVDKRIIRESAITRDGSRMLDAVNTSAATFPIPTENATEETEPRRSVGKKINLSVRVTANTSPSPASRPSVMKVNLGDVDTTTEKGRIHLPRVGRLGNQGIRTKGHVRSESTQGPLILNISELNSDSSAKTSMMMATDDKRLTGLREQFNSQRFLERLKPPGGFMKHHSFASLSTMVKFSLENKCRQMILKQRRGDDTGCLLYTSPSPRDRQKSRMPSSA
eukprot:TRINITY_DN4617_c0_g1_i2.p1 TRINITY_DN4617_c0_g1~~TRINITY_DN4617_c0_g1_i2.p1  ORF type:complete len:745 (-),score=89.20 TRINITY_DN4617_c0_g1_i2:47-2281(-)